MKISERYSSNWLKAEDLDPKGRNLTIEFVEEQLVGDEDKIVLNFAKAGASPAAALPLNKTNAITLAEVLGDETGTWIGHTINVYRDRTMYNGKQTPCIRVRKATGPAVPAVQSAETAPDKGKGDDLAF